LKASEFGGVALKTFREEASMLFQLKSKHVSEMLGLCMAEGHLCLILDYYPNGSLDGIIYKIEEELNWKKRIELALEAAQGMAVIHSHKILHRDIKSMNYLIDQEGHLRISDFGLSVKNVSSVTVTTSSFVGSLPWMAPELFGLGTKFSEECDVYAFGMLLWEIASRQQPYSDVSSELVRENVKAGERLPIPKDTPIGFSTLIEQCWNQDPSKRPLAEMIVQKLMELTGIPVGITEQNLENKIENKIEKKSQEHESLDDLKSELVRLREIETHFRTIINSPFLQEALRLLPKDTHFQSTLDISRSLVEDH